MWTDTIQIYFTRNNYPQSAIRITRCSMTVRMAVIGNVVEISDYHFVHLLFLSTFAEEMKMEENRYGEEETFQGTLY